MKFATDPAAILSGTLGRRIALAVAVMLALIHGFLAISAVKTKSPTFDEPTHFAAGYSYWLRHDFRLDPESGVFAQLWSTLPLLIERPNFPAPSAASWISGAQGEVGTQFLYEVGNDGDSLLLHGRIMIALVSMATCLLVYFWSASVFGRAGALVSTTIAAFCPTLLANGALATSDVCLTFFFGLAAWSVWRMLQRITVLNFVVASLSVAGVFLAKMSGALVVIVVAIMFTMRVLEAREWRRALISMAAIAGIGAVTVATIWAAYGFRFSAVAAGDPYTKYLIARWAVLLDGAGSFQSAIRFARDCRLLPEAYLFGLTYVHLNSGFRPAFLDGNWSVIGFPDFFLRSFFYKTPLPFIALLTLTATAFIVWQRRHASQPRALQAAIFRTTPLWTLLLVYGAFALTAHLNIGHRHILPIYVPLFVVCGGSAFLLATRLRRGAFAFIALLVLWQVGEALASAPHYLSYFNEAAGGPRAGYRHLVDSSVDWGQDLPALRNWLETRRTASGENAHVFLAYFGTADPQHYNIEAVRLGENAATDTPLEPLDAGLYCISATVLQQVYARPMGAWAFPYEQLYQTLLPEFKSVDAREPTAANSKVAARRLLFRQLRFARLCAALRHRAPIAAPGYSILVFELSANDLTQALEGPPAELVEQPQVDGLKELESALKPATKAQGSTSGP